AVPVPLPRLFAYLNTPENQPEHAIGSRVRVPLGQRELTGIVVATDPADSAQDSALKPTNSWLDAQPVLAGELLDSLLWLARYTHAPVGEVLTTALPAALRQDQPLPDTSVWGWQLTAAGQAGLATLRAGGRPRRLADLLAAQPRQEA